MDQAKWLCFLLVLVFMPVVWSGQISPSLESYLQDFTTSSDVEVVVMFEQQADIQSLNQQLKDEKATLAERNYRVIKALQEVATNTQPTMVAYFDDLTAQGYISEYKTMWIANMAIVTATKAGVYAMAENYEIGEITLSYQIEGIEPIEVGDSEESLIASVEPGLEAINAPAAWAAGFTGAGRVVANIDTGVDGDHVALSARFRGDVDEDGDYDESWFDPYSTGWTYPQDSGSHGTHTLGTICGRSEAGDTIGVAIDAQWIAAAAIDRGGDIEGTLADAIESFQWMIDPDGDPATQDNPDAVGNSWGISPIYHGVEACDETLWEVIDNLEAAGTAVVFSAGNEGDYGSNTLRTPSDRATTRYNVFSVGAVNSSNEIADFSSRGPSYCTPDGEAVYKPEVVAPGVNIRSSIPGNSYDTKSGTSMASPHITGAIGVIRGVNPDLDVDAIKEILMTTAHDLGDEGPDNDYGIGIIDVYEACLVAMNGYGYVGGYVYNEDTEEPIANALVSIDGTSRSVTADDEGHFSIGLAADTSYSMTASYFGYISSTVGDIAVTPDETTTQNFYLEPADVGVLHGYVTDLDENPIENATITIDDTPLDPVTTDSDGYYIMDNIPGGSDYLVEVAALSYGYGSATVYVPVADTARQDFSLQELESFEVNNAGYSGEGAWEWGEPTSGPGYAYNGNNVWGTVLGGEYNSNIDDSLISPLFLITSDNAIFSFYHWCEMESTYDGGQIQMSLDNGDTWEIVTPEDGYTDQSIVGLDNTPGFSGTTSDWESVVINLGGYLDEYITLKFRFGSDGSSTYDGWYIDGVVFNGARVLLPAADISQSSIFAEVSSGGNTTETITLSNSGEATLNYDITVLTDVAASASENTETPTIPAHLIGLKSKDGLTVDENGEIKTTEVSPFNYDDVVTSVGGPDDFGYTYIDSEEDNGPEYNWIDISGVGTAITFNGGWDPDDDGYSDPIEMGMTFEFYGVSYDEIQVSTNGWLTFNSYDYSYLTNYEIPYSSEPNNLIAVMWDDLDGLGGTCYYYYDNTDNRFIVSWTDWWFYPDGSTTQFDVQAILDGDDNSIIFQYGEASDTMQTDVSVGIEDSDGLIGLEYAYDNFTGDTGLAIKFIYPAFWLFVDPLIGSVDVGSSEDIDVLFDATELEDGWYYGQLYMATNDPENSEFAVACTLRVGTTDIDDYSSAIPAVFTLDQNYPNPFNPNTGISFGLPASGHVTLDVYDVMGRKVNTLVNGDMAAGTHTVIWDGTNLSGDKVTSGVYFYKLTQGDNTVTKKMMMIK